jgi:hypothetical protein
MCAHGSGAGEKRDHDGKPAKKGEKCECVHGYVMMP